MNRGPGNIEDQFRELKGVSYMTCNDRKRSYFRGVAITAAMITAGSLGLLAGRAKGPELVSAARSAVRRSTGYPQLVSYEPLPPMDGAMCEWAPASTHTLFATALRQEQLARAAKVSSADIKTGPDLDRPPVRVIHDSYPTYSAVAVDPLRNEVVLQDENLFQTLVYDRTANTSPTSSMTEPKRVIGGLKTKVEFNCGLYIDPKNGDIYSVANDTMDTLVIFSHEAEGDVPPDRELHTPHRTYGIAVDEAAQELFLTVEYPPKVVVYRKMAQGEEKPLRVLEGEHTKLADAHGIAIDTKNQLIFVSNHGHASNPRVPGGGHFDPPSITVYPLKSSGDTAPLRVIEGPETQMNWPAGLYLDQDAGDLFVANDVGNSILVFREADGGDAKPLRVLQGPKTGLKNPTGVYVDTQNHELVVANMGNHAATVYQRIASGDVAPLRVIRSAPAGKIALAIGNPGATGYDSKRDEILVPN